MTVDLSTKGSARPEGGREAPALGGGSGAARRFPLGRISPNGTNT